MSNFVGFVANNDLLESLRDEESDEVEVNIGHGQDEEEDDDIEGNVDDNEEKGCQTGL